MSGSQSLPALGTLNRTLTHLAFSSYPALNIGIANMSQTMAKISFEGDFAQQPEVAVGVVPSPEPYVIGVVSVGILRTQALGAAWLNQIQTQSSLGTMLIYPDSVAFPAITLSTVVIKSFDPGAYDGNDPIIAMTLRGVFYANNALWS
ncbi:MAG: hypothetical protein ACYC3L_00930 [Gemmatimonadaceae bacterium]